MAPSALFLAEEIGLSTLLSSKADVFLIVALRMVRLVAFGMVSLILALYLRELGYDERFIGFFMTATFVGDLVSSFWLSLITDRIGRRLVLIASTVIMTLTGLGFSLVTEPYALTVISVLGIMTPSGVEVGPFRSVEQSSIASLVTKDKRSDIYAWYTFLGFFCSAIGSVLCGFLVDFLQDDWNYTLVDAYRSAFIAYTGLSAITIPLTLLISKDIEVDSEEQPSLAAAPTEPVIENSTETESSESDRLLPTPSKEPSAPEASTFSIIVKLSILFGLDAFASLIIPFSWQTYYIQNKFHVSASLLGPVFFTTGIVSGFCSLLSTSLTKRIGVVLTMVGTHLPALFLLTMVSVPRSFLLTIIVLVIRSSTQSMDVAPKHVFVATLVPDSQRTAVFAWVNVVKTLAQLFGPLCAGSLTKMDAQWVSFEIAGSLKIIYDIGILFTFWRYNRHGIH